MADPTAPRTSNVRPGGRTTGGLDTPLSGRQRILPNFRPDPDAFGHATEDSARFMGTPAFLMYMTVFCLFWLGWNTWAPEEWQFDSRALGFTLLTLMLSLQASYAAPCCCWPRTARTTATRSRCSRTASGPSAISPTLNT